MRGVAVALAALLVGSLTLVYQQTLASVEPEEAEVLMRPLASGSSVGANSTNASASVAGTLLESTTNVLYLNNTNASAPWYVKLVLFESSGISNLASLEVGIDNGTAQVEQVVASVGSLTLTSGSYVRLEPSSTNRIYVSQSVSVLGLVSTVSMDVFVADTTAESAYYTMRMSASVI